MTVTEWYLFMGSTGSLAIYHLSLIWMVKRYPLRTDIGINSCIRKAWVRYLMQRRASDVLAVQTLRNALMSASFLASASILLVAGILGFALSSQNLENFNHILNQLGSKQPAMVLWRLLVLVALFFLAFFNFILSLRYYNHVGFMINAFAQETGHTLSEQFVINSIQRGALHFTLGMRSFMLVFPFGLWLLGPEWLLLGTLLLIFILGSIDYPPATLLNTAKCLTKP